MELKFENILTEYELRLENLKLRKEKNLISNEYFEGAVSMNFHWFQEMKSYCNVQTDSAYGVKIDTKNLSIDEKVKYDQKKDFPLVYVIKYRGQEIPVYSDDYGQQDFAVYDGREISGDAYNFFPEIEFTREVDEVLQRKYIETPFSEEEKNKHTFFSEIMKEYEEENKTLEDNK